MYLNDAISNKNNCILFPYLLYFCEKAESNIINACEIPFTEFKDNLR